MEKEVNEDQIVKLLKKNHKSSPYDLSAIFLSLEHNSSLLKPFIALWLTKLALLLAKTKTIQLFSAIKK